VLIAFNKPFGVICRFRPEPDRLLPRLSMDSRPPAVYRSRHCFAPPGVTRR